MKGGVSVDIIEDLNLETLQDLQPTSLLANKVDNTEDKGEPDIPEIARIRMWYEGKRRRGSTGRPYPGYGPVGILDVQGTGTGAAWEGTSLGPSVRTRCCATYLRPTICTRESLLSGAFATRGCSSLSSKAWGIKNMRPTVL